MKLRYNIDIKKVIIVIDNFFHIVAKVNADEFVFNYLKNGYFTYITYVMYKWLHAYDEKTDSYLYFELFKVKISALLNIN